MAGHVQIARLPGHDLATPIEVHFNDWAGDVAVVPALARERADSVAIPLRSTSNPLLQLVVKTSVRS